MNGYKEDTDHSYRISLLLILFFLLLLASSKTVVGHDASTLVSHETSVWGSLSYQNAIICKTITFFHFDTQSESLSLNIGLPLFSIRNKLLDFNRKICQNLITIRKTRLSEEPVCPLKLYFHIPDNKDDIPVLS